MATTTTTDKFTEYSTRAARLLEKAEVLLGQFDQGPGVHLIAAAGVWARLAQAAALADRPATEDGDR